MRKFKHKITGKFVEKTTSGDFYVNNHELIPCWCVENSTDWQEVVEKDYEILEFTTVSTLILRLKPDSFYYTDGELYPFSFEEFYCRNEVKSINKIRRLSDGEVFSLGDRVQTTDKEFNGVIIKMEDYNNKILFHFKSDLVNSTIFIAQHLMQHYKEPIFTTEDGYECTLDDRVFGVLPKANWQTNYYSEKGVPVFKLFNPEGKRWNPSSEWLWFKTKENAEKYIYENKPEFSRKQIKDAIDVCDSYYTLHNDNYFVKVSHLKRLLKL